MDPRRRIPRTDAVLADPRMIEAAARLGRAAVRTAVQKAQDRARTGQIPPEHVTDHALTTLPAGPRQVINATGVLLHTNLGRAPLSAAATHALTAAAGCTDVEFDLQTGHRARRGRSALATLQAAIPTAQAVHIVNNNAAALTLAATALATDKEIIISRGEMIEIGDGFRLPDLITSTGAQLKEVGTTNRTQTSDYANAISEDTGFILKVHPSNFRIEGFTSAAPIKELAGLGPPLVADIGSGLLHPEPLLPDEPDAATALRDGAALVTASADKLLGGPQAGLVAGHQPLIEQLRRHPLARALRVDKLTLAALEATVAGPPTPTERALHTDVSELWKRAERFDLPAVESTATVGGGGAPGVTLPSVALSLPEDLAVRLRLSEPAVVGRITDGRLLLDLRSVPPEQDELLGAVLHHSTSR